MQRAGHYLLACSVLSLASPARAGETVTYAYDALGRLTATSSSGTVNSGVTSSVGYDSAGNRSLYAMSVSGAVAFSVSDTSAVEGGGLVFTVVKSGAAPASVGYGTANGTAAAGADYNGASGTLSFAAGESGKTVAVASLDDSGDEISETLSLNLSGASAGATIADAQGIGTIIDNDDPPPPPPPPPPAFSVSDASAAEGGMINFTVTKTGATTGSFAVGYSTANGTAVGTFNGGDYYSANSSVAFGPTETSKTVTIYTMDDTADESDETLFLNLSNPTGGAAISDAQGIGTIADNDDPPPPPPPGNNPPTPVNDSGSMLRCSIKTFTVTTNDTDPDGDYPLTVISVTGNGFSVYSSTQLEVDSTGLASGDFGTYTVQDLRGATATATLTVTISGGSCNQ